MNQDPARGGCEVVDQPSGRRNIVGSRPAGTASGPHENAASAYRIRKRNVAPLIADDERARDVEVQLARGALDEAVGRLAAVARARVLGYSSARMMRTIVVRVDSRASFAEPSTDVVVHRFNGFTREQPARDPRLIRDDPH